MYYVYMLLCADGSYYTGYTPHLARRMRIHAAGKGGHYTHAHPPKALAGLWCCAEATGARRLEYAIKHRLDRAGKVALLAHPETVETLFPQLAAYSYSPRGDITWEDCLEGRWNE